MPEAAERTTLRVGILSLFPEMFHALSDWGVTGRAFAQHRVACVMKNPREFASDRHGRIDDRPYGGGPGMVMQAPVMTAALASLKTDMGCQAPVIALSPQGQVFTDAIARELAKLPALIFIAGRYEGIDERFMSRSVDRELSLGDFVVSGGELPVMVVLDAIIRHLPGALGHEDSAQQDSFAEGLLDCPHYTRPEYFAGEGVPAVLLSGDHGAIQRWRRAQALHRTLARRPDLMAARGLSEEDRRLLAEWPEVDSQ